ncbi:TolC family protein [Glaciecola sp. MH2013]|uniref:TolC family protein n=1 Tax=Glaciecola sp. MH2013 TaxID=2785524 RepID=UPI00189FC24E|nr:TolC family protein [Glaciecola sp. MH2013]MBF7073070.1 TolC family protein [Glaciecola sp. MH2013]
MKKNLPSSMNRAFFTVFRPKLYLSIALTCLLNVPLAFAKLPEKTAIKQSYPDQHTVQLSLSDAKAAVLQQDQWLQKSQYQEKALRSKSSAALALPDPVVNLSVLNLPTDGFAFDQEAMTQLKVGIQQDIPQGNSREIENQRLRTMAKEEPLLREYRKKQLVLRTTVLWLNAYQAQKSVELTQEALPLVKKLQDLSEAEYSSSFSDVTQQDVIQAEIDIAELSERLIRFKTEKENATAQLGQYLYPIESPTDLSKDFSNDWHFNFEDIAEQESQLASVIKLLSKDKHELLLMLKNHPLFLINKQRIAAGNLSTDLAKQAYKPKWGLNASYGLRSDSPQGNSRADFFSVGVNVNLPLFSNTKVDAEVASSIQSTEAMRTDGLLLLKELLSGLTVALSRLDGLQQRRQIYEQNIIPKLQQQVRSNQSAYASDRGSLSKLVKTKLREVKANITLLQIRSEQYKTLAEVHYHISTSITPMEKNND